jgi:hypothetical protein
MRTHPREGQSVDVTQGSTGRPGPYEIRVRGPIGPMILGAFPAFSARQVGGDTLLWGRLPDQAALYGVLHQLEDLGLELVEVRRPDADGSSNPGDAIDSR